MFSEEVEDALERVEVKPEVKLEEDFEEEEAEGNNDVDYMVSGLWIFNQLLSLQQSVPYISLLTFLELVLILVGTGRMILLQQNLL